jgi:hypothetical protein
MPALKIPLYGSAAAETSNAETTKKVCVLLCCPGCEARTRLSQFVLKSRTFLRSAMQGLTLAEIPVVMR